MFKKITSLLLASSLVLALCAGCGAKDEEPVVDEPETEASDVESVDSMRKMSTTVPVSGTLGTATVTIVGAEEFKDWNNAPAIRFYYDYTNTASWTKSATSVMLSASQEGVELPATSAAERDKVEENDNEWLDIRPGITVRCTAEYSFDPDGENIVFTVTDANNSFSAVVLNVEPGDLPGAPEAFEAQTISDPQWLEGVEANGELADGSVVEIANYEIVDAQQGEANAIRVFVTFANNSGEEASFANSAHMRLMQDGLELPECTPFTAAESDDAPYEAIADGQTITASAVFLLRTDSPIEVEVYNGLTDVVNAGTVIHFADADAAE